MWIVLNNRECFMGVMNFEKVDRIPLIPVLGGGAYNVAVEGSVTANRWHAEGLPAWASAIDYFGLDFAYETIPLNLGMIPPFTAKTLSEDDQCLTVQDHEGVKKRIFKKRSTQGGLSWGMPKFLEFPVKDRKSWEQVKKRYDASDPRRLDVSWGDEMVEHFETTTNPVCLEISCFFGWCRSLMGMENFLVALYRDPGLVHDMMEFRAQFATSLIEPIVERCRVDFILLAEDMAYRNGPHMSPRLVREFIVPRYKEETSLLKRHGVDLVFVDSDGDVRLLVPLWLEAGIKGTYPLEVMAGCDVVDLRKKYPRQLRMVGNIDKMALIEGKEAINAELERKLPFLLKAGGFLPTVDHGIPPEIPFAHYRHYMTRLKEYLEAYS